MRKNIRRFFALFFVFVMLSPLVFPTGAYAASYKYDPNKAVTWAKEKSNVDNTKGECATFVSKCLRQGGLSDVKFSTPGAMVEYLEKKGYGTTYDINDTNLKKIKPGDVIAVFCSKKHDSSKYWGLHTIFVTEVNQDGKYIRYSARNTEHCNEKMTFSALKKYAGNFKCNKCGGKAVGVFVSMKASYTLYSYENHSGKNYLVGTDFEDSLYKSYWSTRGNSISSVSVDTTVKHNGYNSLKIVSSKAGASENDLSIKTLTQGNVKNNGFVGDSKKMILSFWAKSDYNGTKMFFRYGHEGTENYRSVTLSTDWKRYTVRMDKTKNCNSYMYPYIDHAGTVWLAEVQLEDGTAATEFVPEDRGQYKTVTETYGKNYSLPADPTWEGHTFLGWFTSAGGDTQITSSTKVKGGNFCVYAHWDSYNAGLSQQLANPDYTLPTGLTEIRDEAFAGVRAERIKLSKNIKTIGARAFADSGSLNLVIIPAASVSIADNAFAGSGKVRIAAPAGGTVEQYANKHGLGFIAIS